MASESSLKTVLYVVNVLYAVLGLGLAAAGIWFFVQVTEITNLRNSNHYLLDYRVYWLQLTPWLFILLGVFVLFIAFCGWLGATKDSTGVMSVHVIFLFIIIFGQALASTLVFVFVDGEATDRFVKDTIYDGYYNSKDSMEGSRAFGMIERKLRCCGANDARDYKSWRNDLPITCCNQSYYTNYDLNNYYSSGTYGTDQSYYNTYGSYNTYSSDSSYRPFKICDFTDKEANERYGCIRVALVYARIIGSSIAAASLVMAILEIIGLIAAWKLNRIYKGEEHYISRNGLSHHQPEKSETDC